jgi:hypothetical protein
MGLVGMSIRTDNRGARAWPSAQDSPRAAAQGKSYYNLTSWSTSCGRPRVAKSGLIWVSLFGWLAFRRLRGRSRRRGPSLGPVLSAAPGLAVDGDRVDRLGPAGAYPVHEGRGEQPRIDPSPTGGGSGLKNGGSGGNILPDLGPPSGASRLQSPARRRSKASEEFNTALRGQGRKSRGAPGAAELAFAIPQVPRLRTRQGAGPTSCEGPVGRFCLLV